MAARSSLFKEGMVKRNFCVMVLAFFIAGCAATQEITSSFDVSGVSPRFISTQQIRPGLSTKEVESLLGTQVVVGYELTDEKAGQFKPLVVTNPYRKETVGKYEIVYYLAGIKQADDKITDDELLPLVFQNDRLVGGGWSFVEQKIKQPKPASSTASK